MPDRDDWAAAVEGSWHRPVPGEPSDRPGRAMALGAGRAMLEVVVCRSCGSADIHRRTVWGLSAIWYCHACGHRQKESLDVGRHQAHF